MLGKLGFPSFGPLLGPLLGALLGALLVTGMSLAEPTRQSLPDDAAPPAPQGSPEASGEETAEGGEEPADPSREPPLPVEIDDPTNIEAPAFAGVRIRDAFRVRLQSRFMPSANFGSTETSLIRPDLRIRVLFPLSDKAVLQLVSRARTNRYDFSGDHPLAPENAPLRGPSDFYTVSLSLQGAYRVDPGFLPTLAEGEIWSVLANTFARASWQPGAFSDSWTGGGAIAFGYETPNRLRLALGLAVGSRLDGRGVQVWPVVTLRWIVNDWFTLSSRGLGLQADFAVSKPLTLFVSGFRYSDRFRLNSPTVIDNAFELRDRPGFLLGAGFEWKFSKYLRLNAEAGAVIGRNFQIRTATGQSIRSENAPTHGYFDIRIEIRP